MTETRRLAAIMAIDVVGYSRLMGEDEAGTARAVRERREAARPIVASLGGRIVKTMGDGLLLEFPSVVDAVACAIAIQKLMVERNADTPEHKRIVYRIGVNLGDVLIEGEDILGDGVNIAARLEGICDPGGVLLSGSAYDHVRGKIEADFVDLGEKQLKNISRPVRVYALTASALAVPGDKHSSTKPARVIPGGPSRWAALIAACAVAALAAGWFGWRTWPHSPSVSSASDALATAPRLSLMVLPFANLSGDPEQDYFADGITDDLTTDLSHLPDSFVIARNTAFTFKGKAVDTKQIGREFGVRYVLEGSVRRVGEKITANAQLISTETGAHVWADRFEGERSRLGDLQVEFVARLANSLNVELIRAESLRATRERPDNPDAVDLSMRGWVESYRPQSKANSDAAVGLFEHALALDPQLAPAMVGLADALVYRVTNLFSVDPKGDIARAEDLAEGAVAAEPENSAAHMAKALAFFAKRQWAQAIAEVETAIAYNPNNADAHAAHGFWNIFLGQSEGGFSELETAFRLSPRDPSVPSWQFFVCHLHTHLAQWEQSIEWCGKAITGEPGDWYPLVDLAAANAWAGHDKEAKEAAAQLQKVYPGFTVQKWAGIHWTDDPTFNAQYARIVEGLRKAGLPEE